MSISLILSPEDPAIIRKRLRPSIPRAAQAMVRECVVAVTDGTATITLPGVQIALDIEAGGAGSVSLPWRRFNDVLKEVQLAKSPLRVDFEDGVITMGGVRSRFPDIRFSAPPKPASAAPVPVDADALFESASAETQLGMILAVHLTKPAGSTPGTQEEIRQLALAFRRLHWAAGHLAPLGISGDELISVIVRRHLGSKPVGQKFAQLPPPH